MGTICVVSPITDKSINKPSAISFIKDLKKSRDIQAHGLEVKTFSPIHQDYLATEEFSIVINTGSKKPLRTSKYDADSKLNGAHENPGVLIDIGGGGPVLDRAKKKLDNQLVLGL